MPIAEEQVEQTQEQPVVDSMHKTVAAEFYKRLKGADWRALGWNMKNDEKTGALTFTITFPGNSTMEQTVLTKQQQEQDGRRPVQTPPAPAPVATPAAPATEPTAQAMMASRKVEIKVAMTKEAAVKITKEKYPPKFLKAMGL